MKERVDVRKRPDAPEDAVLRLAEEVLKGSELFVVDLRVRGHSGSHVVELFVDSEHPFGVDVLARVSRELGFLLDTEEVLGVSYRLDVSSPGADRPLRVPRQYRRHVGRDVELLVRTEAGKKTINGSLVEAGDASVTVETSDGPLPIQHTDIIEGKVKLPW